VKYYFFVMGMVFLFVSLYAMSFNNMILVSISYMTSMFFFMLDVMISYTSKQREEAKKEYEKLKKIFEEHFLKEK